MFSDGVDYGLVIGRLVKLIGADLQLNFYINKENLGGILFVRVSPMLSFSLDTGKLDRTFDDDSLMDIAKDSPRPAE